MHIAFFSTKPYEPAFFDAASAASPGLALRYLDAKLTSDTAGLAQGCEAACIFVNDDASAATLEALAGAGVRALLLRCAGFNNVDVHAAHRLGITVARVPAYSPASVAEHAVALIMALSRKTHRAYNRVREHNFDIDGLLGFELRTRTVGCVGTGRIGLAFCSIVRGFGSRVLAFDPQPAQNADALGITYVPLDQLLHESDIVALHCPLTPATKHLINARTLATMKQGAVLINTSRGGVVDTRALIAALKAGKLAGVGLDVYEEEGDLFFRDLSEKPILDDTFARLLTFPNVLVTAHQAFFTREAMEAIASTTIANAHALLPGGQPKASNLVTPQFVRA